MPSVDSILNKGNKLMDKSENDLIDVTKTAESIIYQVLLELFDNVDITNGKLSSSQKAQDFIATLQQRVYKALSKSNYTTGVKDFISNFDAIAGNSIDLHQKLGNGILNISDVNAVKRIEVAKTIGSLTEAGLYTNFIEPVTQGLYRNIMFGATVSETKDFIKNYVLSKEGKQSKLLRYVSQVATDSVRQLDGSINQGAKVALGLDGTKYVGSIIQDSRAQCIKWIDMSVIPDEDLAAEIDFALMNRVYKDKRCSGMIPGTNTATFCINRGGFNCRHRAFPVRLRK